jgi:Arc/MetJ-type ribon-helix-helix transcriptional regulator
MTDGLVRVRAELNLPGEVWAWIEEQVRGRLFENPAEAMTFLLVSAKKSHYAARETLARSPWPTPEERREGRAERIE